MSGKALPPLAKKLMKGLIVAEVLGILGAYGLFRAMDQSQDFRSSVNRRLPSILEVYYKSNEMAGVYGARQRDLEAWSERR
ncbi:protein CEBPZOS-like [Stigmatopora argus]